jgi:hypothetical protein
MFFVETELDYARKLLTLETIKGGRIGSKNLCVGIPTGVAKNAFQGSEDCAVIGG